MAAAKPNGEEGGTWLSISNLLPKMKPTSGLSAVGGGRSPAQITGRARRPIKFAALSVAPLLRGTKATGRREGGEGEPALPGKRSYTFNMAAGRDTPHRPGYTAARILPAGEKIIKIRSEREEGGRVGRGVKN